MYPHPQTKWGSIFFHADFKLDLWSDSVIELFLFGFWCCCSCLVHLCTPAPPWPLLSTSVLLPLIYPPLSSDPLPPVSPFVIIVISQSYTPLSLTQNCHLATYIDKTSEMWKWRRYQKFEKYLHWPKPKPSTSVGGHERVARQCQTFREKKKRFKIPEN